MCVCACVLCTYVCGVFGVRFVRVGEREREMEDCGGDVDMYLQFVLEEVFLVGELAIEAEEALLVG